VLSPGKYHLLVPKAPLDNLRYRQRLLDRCTRDAQARDQIMRACKDDCLFWIDSFAFQYNPRKPPGEKVGPFILWDFQAKAVRSILDRLPRGRDILIEKSRYMGASWLVMLVQAWSCLFHEWENWIDISHTEDAVDDLDDPNSLYWKLDFVHEHLPSWMAGTIKRKRLQFKYTRTNSFANGYATTVRAGVGGRGTVVLDEFAKHQSGHQILSQTADTGPRIFISTHYDTGNAFFELSERPDIDRVVMHWTQHPDLNPGLYHYDPETRQIVTHDDYPFPEDYPFVREVSPTGGPFPGLRSPWYDEECIRRGKKRDVAMHLDIDARGAQATVFDSLLISRLKRAKREPDFVGELEYTPDGVPTKLRSDPEGCLRLWTPLDGDRPPRDHYAAGADISRGTGATPTCFSVINSRGQKVAGFASPNYKPEPAAVYAVALCRFFADQRGRGAYLCAELPGPGQEFVHEVVRLGYLNLYWKKDAENSVYGRKDSDIPGFWNTGKRAMVPLIENYAAALEDGRFVNWCEYALAELPYFRWIKTGTIEHTGAQNDEDPSQAREGHGDRAVADALALWGSEDAGFLVAPSVAAAKKPVNLYGSAEGLAILLADEDKRKARSRAWARIK
jgi:hypothetical protein